MAGTTLAQGSSVTLTLAATDSVLIDSAAGGRARIEAVSGVNGAANQAVLATHPGGQATYGPFGAGSVKVIAIGGSLAYMQGTAPLSDEGGFARFGTDASGNVTSLVDGAGNTVPLQTERTYISRGWREEVIANGSTVEIAPQRTSPHDLMYSWPSLINPLTGAPNFAVLNVAQQLTAIPGASSAPYWTDPGALVYNAYGTGNGYIPASVPGQVDFETVGGINCVRFTTPVGYGDGEAGKRRIQLNSYQITTRIPVRWEINFMIPSEDDSPYDAATGYNYPYLFWQLKEPNSQPVWQVGIETTSDPNVFVLYVTFLYSDYESDVSTYRRQYNAVSGTVGTSKSATRVCTATVRKGVWNSMSIEMFLDERDHTTAGGGQGYAMIDLNGSSILHWSGPTYMKTPLSGGTALAHRWSIGIYRHEYSLVTSGVPAGLEELNLNRQTDPAPYRRTLLVSRCRMVRLD